ncbi:MAG: hypothetical protein ACLR8U_02460 [Oscillospiraceae bacterium]
MGIRKGCGRGIEKIPEAFERAGVQALVDAENMPLILMDEVGRIESGRRAVLFLDRRLTEGLVPVIWVSATPPYERDPNGSERACATVTK